MQETEQTTTKTCQKCKQQKDIQLFIKNSKILKTCYQCRKQRFSTRRPVCLHYCATLLSRTIISITNTLTTYYTKDITPIQNPEKVITKEKQKTLHHTAFAINPTSEFISKKETKHCQRVEKNQST